MIDNFLYDVCNAERLVVCNNVFYVTMSDFDIERDADTNEISLEDRYGNRVHFVATDITEVTEDCSGAEKLYHIHDYSHGLISVFIV